MDVFVKWLHRGPVFCKSKNGSLPGSSVHGTSQARILDWVAVFCSRDHPYSGIKAASAVLADTLPLSGMRSPAHTHTYKHTDHIFFIHSSISACLGCFHILVIVNNAVMNIRVHVCFQISVLILFLSVIHLGVELLSHMVVLLLVF